MENNSNQETPKKKKNRVWMPIAGICLIVILSAVYFYRDYARYISSDDAKIESDNVSISAKIMGRINLLHVNEGDSTKTGMLLVELDSSDLYAQKKQALAAKQQAVAAVSQSEARYNYDRESIKVLEINFSKTQDDFNRAKEQFKGEVITQEQFDHSRRAFETAQAQLDATKSQLLVSKAQINTAQAAVESSGAQVGVINSQLNNTRIYAPMNAIVARRWLLPGDIAQPGQSIFSLSSTTNRWVSIYLEETKIADVFIGQKLKFTVDAFPSVTFLGTISFIGSNTAGQFSLIPASNASGNFTKVTQRIQVKASIDGTENNSALSRYDLRAGMSVVAKIFRK
jgi:membrane fusion protein (multidrug efflux system)